MVGAVQVTWPTICRHWKTCCSAYAILFCYLLPTCNIALFAVVCASCCYVDDQLVLHCSGCSEWAKIRGRPQPFHKPVWAILHHQAHTTQQNGCGTSTQCHWHLDTEKTQGNRGRWCCSNRARCASSCWAAAKWALRLPAESLQAASHTAFRSCIIGPWKVCCLHQVISPSMSCSVMYIWFLHPWQCLQRWCLLLDF